MQPQERSRQRRRNAPVCEPPERFPLGSAGDQEQDAARAQDVAKAERQPLADRGRRLGQHGVAARQRGERGNVTEGIEALRRLVQPQMPVPPEPEDAEVDGPGLLQRRRHPPAFGARIRRVALNADPALGRHREGAPHRALQVGGAARRVMGAEAGPLVELNEARAREPIRGAGEQCVSPGRRVPAREANQEIGPRARRLPDERGGRTIQRLPVRKDGKAHCFSPRRPATDPRAWLRRS